MFRNLIPNISSLFVGGTVLSGSIVGVGLKVFQENNQKSNIEKSKEVKVHNIKSNSDKGKKSSSSKKESKPKELVWEYLFFNKEGKCRFKSGHKAQEPFEIVGLERNCLQNKEKEYIRTSSQGPELWIKGDASKLRTFWGAFHIPNILSWFDKVAERVFRKDLNLGWSEKTIIPKRCDVTKNSKNLQESWHCWVDYSVVNNRNSQILERYV